MRRWFQIPDSVLPSPTSPPAFSLHYRNHDVDDDDDDDDHNHNYDHDDGDDHDHNYDDDDDTELSLTVTDVTSGLLSSPSFLRWDVIIVISSLW